MDRKRRHPGRGCVVETTRTCSRAAPLGGHVPENSAGNYHCAWDQGGGLRSVLDMATHSRESEQKVEIGGQGVGGFSELDLERRARELALIDNRADATEEDRASALAEFRDEHLPDAVNEDADSMQSLSRDPSDPMVDRGRQVPNHGGDDEKAALEHLALEGVEEAQHEQMVQARNDVDEPLRSRPGRKQG